MAPKLPPLFFFFFLLLFFSPITLSAGRLISDSSSDLVSDGVHDGSGGLKLLRFNHFLGGAEEACEQSYGFLPCTTTALGNTFLIIVYGYLMYLAATYLSAGSELLLETLGPGLVGGLFLPMLGALPDAMLILVSGLSGTPETAQSQVSVGIGLLAGSTVMLLTVIWGTCVVVGKCDLDGEVATDGKDTKGLSLTGSGVSTDIWTSYSAGIMVVSVIPFLVVQLPQLLHSTSGRHLAVLIALITSVVLLISYCIYQVIQPSYQKRRLAFAKHKHVRASILKNLRKEALGKCLLTDDGTPNGEILKRLFSRIDVNKDDRLSISELRALIIGIQFDELNVEEDNALDKVLKDLDTSEDCLVDFQEFLNGITRWVKEAQGYKAASHPAGADSSKMFHQFHEQTKREHDLLGDQSDEVAEGVEDPKSTSVKAVLFLLLGTVIAATFADPLVDAVNNFSTATSIPTFFISFIALPLATNSSEAVSAIIFASRKKLRSASLTFSELYGAVTMNNVLCLSVFLALVYVRGLVWDFSAEVLVILIVCLVMGVFGSVRTTFPLWTCSLAFLLYPLSLALVYVLDYVFGWS